MNQPVEIHEGPMGQDEFINGFVVPGKPVLLKGAIKSFHAFDAWDMDYFRALDNSKELNVKYGNVGDGQVKTMDIKSYVDLLDEFERSQGKTALPPYLHDVAIFNTFPELVHDIPDDIKNYFSAYYEERWWSYMQFFMSVTGHVTPLHFDTLMTNNTFFQVKGKKRFILIPWDQRESCYMKGWRWAEVNPSKPDLDKHRKFSQVEPQIVEIEGGDILFMPSGMLHQVETLSLSISFNIDWHSNKSVSRGLGSFVYGAPWKNIYYNMLIYMGLRFKVPEKVIYKYYRSYLGYIS